MNVTPIFKQIDPNHPQLKEFITASIGNPTADKINTVLASYEKDGKLIGAFISNQLIGCVGYTVNAGHLVIRHLSVAEDFQNKKIATNLMRYILAFEDCHELSASTDIEAQGFYAKLLFQCIKTDSRFDTDRFECVYLKKHDFQSIFEQGPFDVILHYASPYDVNTRLDNVSEQLRKNFYQCMSHDQLLLDLAYNNLNKNGSLIISGAIIADDIFIGQSGMSGIHKANLKRIAAEYHNLSIHQKKPIHIKYLNLGSFKDEVTQIEDGMPTEEVITKILNIIDHPTQFAHKIDIMTPFEANKYGYDI